VPETSTFYFINALNKLLMNTLEMCQNVCRMFAGSVPYCRSHWQSC